MKKVLVSLLFLLLFIPTLKSQEETDKTTISGFINAETFFDTRQTVSAREGDVLLFPANINPDIEGNDINEVPNFNMLSLFSRIRLETKGISAFGAKSTGYIETDLAGAANNYLSHFRLRHAFVKLNWTKTELIMGKYWHPMFVTECFPSVVTWGAGIPYSVLSRNPQLRFTYQANNLKLKFALLSQRDFSSNGPDGKSSKYLRNSGIPDMQFQPVLNISDNLLVGATIGYKILKPQSKTDSSYYTDETIGAFNSNIFLKYKTDKFEFKTQFIYGENLNNFLMIGGFAVKETTDPTRDIVTYTNTKTSSFWIDLTVNLNKISLGTFIAITNNLGSDNTIIDPAPYTIYSMGSNIDQSIRIAPRISWKSGQTKIAFETTYDITSYGVNDQSLKVINTEDVSNVRFLFSVFRYFKTN